MSKDVAEGTQRPLLYAKQAEVADRAMSIILRDNSSKIDVCRAFEWYILMPYYKALSDQMISRIKKWIVQIRDQGKSEDIDYTDFMRDIHPTDSRTNLYDHVIRLGTGAKDIGENKKRKNEMEKFNAMVERIKQNPDSFFFVVMDTMYDKNMSQSRKHVIKIPSNHLVYKQCS